MRPARFQLALDERIAGKALQYAPVRHGAAAIFLRDGHFLAVGRVAADRRIDGAGIVPDSAADDAHIRPGQTVILQLRGQRGVRKVVLGRDNEAGCVLVDAMDDAGALFPADAGQGVAAVGQQRVDERAVRVTGGRVDDKPLGLVHDDHVRVLIADLQRNVLRRDVRFVHLRNFQLQRRPGGELFVLFDGPSGLRDRTLLDQALGLAAGQLRHEAAERAVEPFAVFVKRQRHAVSSAPSACRPAAPYPSSEYRSQGKARRT